MKKLILMILMTSATFAASVTVPKFEIRFLLDESLYKLDFTLKMACMREKFVISDSAQYEYKTQTAEIVFKRKKLKNGLTEFIFSSPRTQKVTMRNSWYSEAECRTYENFYLVSRKYRSGYGSVDKPRAIKLGIFEHTDTETTKFFDVDGYRDLLEEKELHFVYKEGYRVRVSFAIDGEIYDRMGFYSSTSVAADPDTGMPYEL